MKLEIEIPDAHIVNALETGLVGIRYWGEQINEVSAYNLFHHNDHVEIMDYDYNQDDTPPILRLRLTWAKVLDGLREMAEKSPLQFGRILGDTSDNTTGDLLIQYALFGEEKYS